MDWQLDQPDRRRRSLILRLLLKGAAVYLLLVFLGGTLQQMTDPAAAEMGEVMHTITLIEPTIAWADEHHMGPLAAGLRFLADGLSLHGLLGRGELPAAAAAIAG